MSNSFKSVYLALWTNIDSEYHGPFCCAITMLLVCSDGRFCQGGAVMEALMFELRGQALCDRLNIDTIEHFNPVDVARQWALDCVKQL